MTPETLAGLLRDWPPKTEHWPPRDKSTWRPGMMLLGMIEAVMKLPRPQGSNHRGELYTALRVRRIPDGAPVTWHGWHTTTQDIDNAHPAPGLLFGCIWRGQGQAGGNTFDDFKYMVAWPDDASTAAAPAGSLPAPPAEASPVTQPPADGAIDLDAELATLGISASRAKVWLRKTREFSGLREFGDLDPAELERAVDLLAKIAAQRAAKAGAA
jgi:hypothetical protein